MYTYIIIIIIKHENNNTIMMIIVICNCTVSSRLGGCPRRQLLRPLAILRACYNTYVMYHTYIYIYIYIDIERER